MGFNRVNRVRLFILVQTMSIVGRLVQQWSTGPTEVFKSEKALARQKFCVWLDRAF